MTAMELPAGIAVVTGAASGKGLASAQLMAAAGWPVLMCDLHADRLAAAVADLPEGTRALAGDINDPAYVEALVAKLDGEPIGALVHCAGLSPTQGSAERILDANLAATMRLIETVRAQMRSDGAAVLFASCSGQQMGDVFDAQIAAVATPEQGAGLASRCNGNTGAAYSISKREVQALVRREAKSFGRQGLRIASISPGIIDTPMGRAEMAQQPIMQKMVENSALRRPARAEEVAAVAVFLCSPAASFLTGIDVLVDGGCLPMPMPMPIQLAA